MLRLEAFAVRDIECVKRADFPEKFQNTYEQQLAAR